MADTEYVHHHYWPGEGCISLTPQASRYGYVFPVYATKTVWGECITWTPNKKRKGVSAETRIYDLLHACYVGMGKALSEVDDRVYYTFLHWFWERLRPQAKKKAKAKYGARLLLDPETDEPWLLIFDPANDGQEVLEYGELKENRTADAALDEQDGPDVRLDGPGVDFGEEAV